MKPLTKTVVSRGGGIAGRFAKGGDAPVNDTIQQTRRPETPPVVSPEKPAAGAKPNRRYDKWREANPELYKERQRAYQQNYRARRRTEKERE